MPSTTHSEKLRLAVSAGNYAEAQQLLTQFGSEVESQWHAAPADQRSAIASDATNLLQWAKHTILAARAHVRHQHAQLAGQSAYSKSAAPRSFVDLNG
jgi:hypothetical protein